MRTPNTLTFETMVSGADLSGYVGKGVKVSSGTWVAATDNAGIGIVLDGGAASGDNISVGFGEVMALAGGTVAVGDLVSFNSSSVLITAVSGDTPVGRCLQGGGSGEWIRVFLYGAVDEAVA